MTPPANLGLQPVQVEIPAKFSGQMGAHTLNVPPGFRVKLFQISGLSGPRFLTFGPDSVLYVSNPASGRIVALPDRDHDGVADEAKVVATNAFGHGLAFHGGALYVAEEQQVLRLTDTDGDGVYETRQTLISGIPGGGGHTSRTIAFDEARHLLYLSVGSSCNVCRETNRGAIYVYNDDGTNGRVMATGARNAVGLTIRPRTGRLWATNNNSDNQGNDVPPEWVDLVRDGGFYGWPFAYGDGTFFDFNRASDYQALLPITSADSAKVRRIVPPAALVQAHSAPMEIEFATDGFPTAYRHGAFVALHGSWNRTPPTGFKLIYLDFASDADTTANSVADFLTGFMTGSSGSSAQTWARPVGLAADARGNLYVGSDAGTQAIFIVSPPATTAANETPPSPPLRFELRQNSPNPFNPTTTIRYDLAAVGPVRLDVFDALGRRVSVLLDETQSAGPHTATFSAAGLPSGVYLYRLSANGQTVARRMTLDR